MHINRLILNKSILLPHSLINLLPGKTFFGCRIRAPQFPAHGPVSSTAFPPAVSILACGSIVQSLKVAPFPRPHSTVSQLHQDTHPKLLQFKGLGQIIICAAAQKLHLVVQRIFSSQHDNRDPAGCPYLPEQLPPGRPGSIRSKQQVKLLHLPQKPSFRS